MYKLCITLVFCFIMSAAFFSAGCSKKIVSTEPESGDVTGEYTAQQPETTDVTVDESSISESDAAEAQAAREKAAKEIFVNTDIHFKFDSAVLDSSAQNILKLKGEWMLKHPGVSVIIEGHCDERGTSEYNIALGDRRAESARQFMVDLGIAPERLTTISYGEERPLDPGHNETAWRKNRRVHFTLK